jgi:TonB family protein
MEVGQYEVEVKLDGYIASKQNLSVSKHKSDDLSFTMRDRSLSQTNSKTFRSAVFPGGDVAMYRFIALKQIYTDEMKAEGVNGTVVVNFEVDDDGFINNAIVTKGVNSLLDEDALRVVRSMPKWMPSTNGEGENVSSHRTIRVRYGGNSGDDLFDDSWSPSRISYSLGDRKIMATPKKSINSIEREGRIVVGIIVDKYGKVVKATPVARGSTSTDDYLGKLAIEAAYSTKFDYNPDAPIMQPGSMTFTFISADFNF